MASSYVQSTISMLYVGMVVPHDIYNSNYSLLLVPQGSILSEVQIERLKKYNEGAGKIYVSAETERLLQKHREMLTSISPTKDIEDATGYTDVSQETIDMLEKVALGDVVSHSELCAVSEELSHTVEVTAPSVILDLVNALASADEYLQRHCVDVGMLNGLCGKWLGLPKETVDTLILIGLLHDCGKAALPNVIFSAPRPLTNVEFEVVKLHPVLSHGLLSEFPEVVRLAARGHHEKINGRGYPNGLSGDSIPFMSRITAVSDIYDAMVSRRSYKPPNSPFKILSVLNSLRGTELDERLADMFIANMSGEMIGKKMLLSDDSIATVISVDPDNLEFPTVELDGKVIFTDNSLFCVTLHYES